MLISRILSVVVAIGYLVAALIGAGPAAALQVAVYLLLPLACIWFSGELGSLAYVKGIQLKETPGCFVAAGGWMLLLLPIGIAIGHLATVEGTVAFGGGIGAILVGLAAIVGVILGVMRFVQKRRQSQIQRKSQEELKQRYAKRCEEVQD